MLSYLELEGQGRGINMEVTRPLLLVAYHTKQIRQQCTEVRFASLLSGGNTTMAVINPPEKKLVNRTSVQCTWRVFFFSKWSSC